MQLDLAPKTIRLHVYVIAPEESVERSSFAGAIDAVEKSIRNMTQEGKLSVISEAHLTTLEQLEARVQAGMTKSVVSGRSGRSISPSALASLQRRAESDERTRSQLAAALRSHTLECVSADQRGPQSSKPPLGVAEEGTIIVDFDFERSDVMPVSEADEESGKMADQSTATVQTTIRIPDGQATLVQQISDPSLTGEWLLVVGAELVDHKGISGTAKRPIRRPNGDENRAEKAAPQNSVDNVAGDIPEKFLRWALDSVKRYDRDEDGALSADEMSLMRRPPGKQADINQDGRVTVEEFARSVMPKKTD